MMQPIDAPSCLLALAASWKRICPTQWEEWLAKSTHSVKAGGFFVDGQWYDKADITPDGKEADWWCVVGVQDSSTLLMLHYSGHYKVTPPNPEWNMTGLWRSK